MLTTRVIARLDLKAPQGVVKGRRMDGLRALGPAPTLAARAEADGADEILALDIVASLYGRVPDLGLIQALADPLMIPLTVGGGIRSVADMRALLRVGADKIALNTAALARPALIRECAEAFGRQAVVISIEAKRRDAGWQAYTRGGREPSGRSVVAWAQEAVASGAGEVLLTAVDCDGIGAGTDLELVATVARAVPTVPLVISGGVGEGVHALAAIRAGADAVAVASALYRPGGLGAIKATLAHCMPIRSIHE